LRADLGLAFRPVFDGLFLAAVECLAQAAAFAVLIRPYLRQLLGMQKAREARPERV